MALFKIFRGPESRLNSQALHEGYAWFTEDKHNLYIDLSDQPGNRVQVNAYGAEVLQAPDGSVIEIDDLLLKEIGVQVAEGGTGRKELTVNAILVGNGTDPIKLVSLTHGGVVLSDSTNGITELKGTGILYALTEGAPQFGVAPIEAGGTGGNTAAAARTQLDVYSKGETDEKTAESTSLSYSVTLTASAWTASSGKYIYNYGNTALSCGKNHNVPPIITYTSNLEEYSKIESAEATAGQGIVFTSPEQPTADIGIIIIDVK